MSKSSSLPRIAILGAGPIGLEAALYARQLGYPVDVYEAGQAGNYVQQWGHVRLFSPFGMNVTTLGRNALLAKNPQHEFPQDGDCITGRELLECYLKPLAESELLKGCIHLNARIVSIGREDLLKEDAIGDARRSKQPFRILVENEKNQERITSADIVFDCTGTYGQHRWLGQGGIPALGERAAERHICYTLEDVLGQKRNHYAGKNILVIGAGYSAATTVSQLATLAEQHPETWVIWATRGSKTQPIHRISGDVLKERDRLAVRANLLATRQEGNVEFHPHTAIETIAGNAEQGFRIQVEGDAQSRTWTVDRIIANVGYTPNREIYRELQIHECYATFGPIKLAAALLSQGNADCLKQASPGAEVLKNPEPNFYILGAKSYGRNSLFLLRTGFQQIRDVFRLVTGKKDLDLYQNK